MNHQNTSIRQTFREIHNRNNCPTECTIRRLINQFETTG